MKETYYQRKKRENAELIRKLKSDIRILVENNDFAKVEEIKYWVRYEMHLEETIMYGSKSNNIDGLISSMGVQLPIIPCFIKPEDNGE